MPPDIPVRVTDGDYRFHVYDYAGSGAADKGPFEMSEAQPARNNWQFYSLVQDLNGLYDVGEANEIPGIALTTPGFRIPPLAPPGEQNRHTMALSLGNANMPTVVITAGIHAREWIAPEMAYLLAEYLVINYTAAPQNKYQRTIWNLVNSRRIHIVPMLNPHGNHYTVFSPAANARMWRKNRRALPGGNDWVAALTNADGPNPPFRNVQAGMNPQYDVPNYDPAHKVPPRQAQYQTRLLQANQTGVDLNRNCDTTAWGYDCAPGYDLYDPSGSGYFGPRAGSEVETRNIQEFLTTAGVLAAAIDYHSYGKMILYPPEAFNDDAVSPDYRALGQALQLLIKPQAQQVLSDYKLGSPFGLFGYEGTGSIIDHTAQQYRARAFTIELDPAWDGGTPAGFQLPETQIRTVFEKNIRGALAAIAAPKPATTWLSEIRRSSKISLAALQFLTWDVYGRGNQLPA